jgi:hypothetical protein
MKRPITDTGCIPARKTAGVVVFDVMVWPVEEVQAFDGGLPVFVPVTDARVHEKAGFALHAVVLDERTFAKRPRRVWPNTKSGSIGSPGMTPA